MILLLADENFPIASHLYLRDKGYDIIHINEEGLTSSIDEDIVTISIAQDRVILTFDSDFGELIFKLNYQPTGVVFFRWRRFKPKSMFGGLSSCKPIFYKPDFENNSSFIPINSLLFPSPEPQTLDLQFNPTPNML